MKNSEKEEKSELNYFSKKVRKNKPLNILGFIFALYFFIFSLTLIKVSSEAVGKLILALTKGNFSEINALGFGWLTTLLTQSSGAAATTLIAFSLAGIIGPIALIYMMIGTRIGTSITALFTAFLVRAEKRDFRHGFEIGIANLVYAIPIAIIMFMLEFLTGFFSKTGNYVISLGIPVKFDFVNIITKPLINLFSIIPIHLNILIGVILLILSLKYLPLFMVNVWGEEYLKRKINLLLDKKWKSFFLGFIITTFLMSTSITITFLIPFVVTKITTLKHIIPYLIGANLGGVSEIIIGGFILGRDALPAVFTYVSFSIMGLFWMVKPSLIFNITKAISKKTLNISRRRALLFIIAFVLFALVISIL